MTKKQFVNQLIDNYVNLDHVSKRKLDYKYHEYLLFQILLKHYHDDFKILGLPLDLTIQILPPYYGYHFHKITHVTLNYQLYKLYECNYYKSELELVEATLEAARRYKNKAATIKQLGKELGRIRKDYLNSI